MREFGYMMRVRTAEFDGVQFLVAFVCETDAPEPADGEPFEAYEIGRIHRKCCDTDEAVFEKWKDAMNAAFMSMMGQILDDIGIQPEKMVFMERKQE